MTTAFGEIDPNFLAAILYRPEDHVDALLADFAQDLAHQGARVGGIVQRYVENANGTTIMLAVDIATGREISICQSLGTGATSCKLDTSGLAEAASVVSRAINENADLIVINKFSSQEALGQGLRAEFSDAIVHGLPLLTAVPAKCLADWRAFTGDAFTTLACERQCMARWWNRVDKHLAAIRVHNSSHSHLGTIIPDRLITVPTRSTTADPRRSGRFTRHLRKQP